jgi:hypothetical protein
MGFWGMAKVPARGRISTRTGGWIDVYSSTSRENGSKRCASVSQSGRGSRRRRLCINPPPQNGRAEKC